MQPLNTNTHHCYYPPVFDSTDGKTIKSDWIEVNYHELVQIMIREDSTDIIFDSDLQFVPDIYEKIKEEISNRFPDHKKLLKEVKEKLNILSLENAQKLIEMYPEHKHCRRIKEAEKLIALSYTFDSEAEASDYFAKRKLDCLALMQRDKAMKEIQARKVKKAIVSDPAEMNLEETKIYSEALFGAIFLLAQEEELNFDNMPLYRQLRLVNKVKADPRFAIQAETSAKKIQEYKELVEGLYPKCIGRPIPPEFFEVICGPKGMIFSYYGFKLNQVHRLMGYPNAVIESDSYMYPLSHPEVPNIPGFRYSLENDNIADFEKEIRKDLTDFKVKLPPPLFANETAKVVIPLKETDILFQRHFNEIGEKWDTASDQEKANFKEEFLAFTHLNNFGIVLRHTGLNTDHLNFTSFEKNKAIKGYLALHGCEVKFTFDLERMRFYLDLLQVRDFVASYGAVQDICIEGADHYHYLLEHRPPPQ